MKKHLTVLILLLAGCAHMGSPDGGERDTTPPEVIYHEPALEAINVPGDADLLLRFSKYMDRASVEQAAFFSPPLDGKIKWRWRGRSVRVTHAERFATELTTVMTLGSGVRDYLGNEMEESFALAFSTSAELERGELRAGITGLIRGETAELWLVDSITTDMQPLHVLPVTTATGECRFRYLPAGKHELVAVQDINHDRQWDPFSERIGLPRQQVQVPDSVTLHLLHLQFSYPDTVIFTTARQLNSEVAQLQGYFPDSLRNASIAISSNTNAEESIGAELLYANSAQAWILLPELPPVDSLQVVISDRMPLRPVLLKQTAHVDSLVPEMMTLAPVGVQVPPGNEVTISAGEPVRLAHAAGVQVVLNGSDTLRTTGEQPFAEGSVVQFERSWSWSDSCRIHVAPLGLQDAAGNTFPDTLRRRGFVVRSHDTLGGLAGTVSGPAERDDVRVDLLDLEGKLVRTVPATPGFSFLEIPTGDYLMRLFLDLNGDSRFSSGSVEPTQQYAEPYLVLRDTFQVAPRWVVEGLRLNGEELVDE